MQLSYDLSHVVCNNIFNDITMSRGRGDFFFKVVLIGDVGVGKSSIFKRYRDGVFFENLSGTVGLDYYQKSIDVGENREIKLSLWDTAGMERAGTLTGGHYSGSHGVLLTYAVDDLSSFGALNGWRDNALRYTENAVFFLVGNKIDEDPSDYEIKHSTVSAFCDRHNIPERNCFTVSAKTNEGLDSMYQDIANILTRSAVPHQQRRSDAFQIQPTDQIDGPKCNC